MRRQRKKTSVFSHKGKTVRSETRNTDSSTKRISTPKTTKKSGKKDKPKKMKKVLAPLFMVFFVVAIVLCGVFFGMYAAVSREIKDMDIQNLALNYSSVIYYTDERGNSHELEQLFNEGNRIWLNSDQIPKVMKDAVVAIDPSVLGEDIENAQRGGEIGAIATPNVVCHFIHADGKSDSENELYFNEIIDDGEKIRVYGQRKRDININYKNNQVFHAFFLISDGEYSASEYNFYGIYSVKDDGTVWDLPKGKELIIDAEPASDKYPAGRPERTYPVYIEYAREADENNGEVLSEKKYSNVEIAEMLDEAFAVIAEHGYDVAKNKPANFD